MRRGRRSKLEIYASILEAIKRERKCRVTRILLYANLSYDRLIKYLTDLEKAGLIEKEKHNRGVYYRVTAKGDEFLKEYQRIVKFIESFGLRL
ncbi:MAG: hypothetical protein DRJ52_01495 [Thermoprotei archaeon]|nr:MAG: hypothetical protein DRJ52_01495 [Thermoprotei archaeon]RLF00157.1 MAG: hypothetical protein DRJ63_03315 [Thermoprotei archaeon]HDI74998.1 hypothetical protein [Thermoprotei archaeon]